MFYLCASRGLGDPNRRHWYTNVGHAISQDLVNWEVLPDALSPSDSPAFDSWTTWTGSVIQDEDGLWWMFYTGNSREESGKKQTIGAATSSDLVSWTKISSDPLITANYSWYEELDLEAWHDEAWRDPFVFRHSGKWKMLITGRSRNGDPSGRGVIAQATSEDLLNWEVGPPISETDQGFGQLEVLQYEVVDGYPTIIFSCGWNELQKKRQELSTDHYEIFSVAVDEELLHVDVSKSQPVESTELYAPRLVQGPDGNWNLIGFKNIVAGEFVGELSDPIPVTADQNGLILK